MKRKEAGRDVDTFPKTRVDDSSSAKRFKTDAAGSECPGDWNPQLLLTKDEQWLVCLLRQVLEENARQSTKIRIAGGWVRDKLLNRPSNDVDVTLDSIPGKDFAFMVNEYLQGQGDKLHKIGIIQANPEQSKHLETASMHLHGFFVDFCHLRAEEYTPESRIPAKIEFGTPIEDAKRRDFTINSLFYDIVEEKVEDYTGKGLQDLRDGIIRTPLQPMETFRDDPLRILRALRFSNRYQFELAQDLVEALKTPGVFENLDMKVSRERIGTEFRKMLDGNHPFHALRLLDEYNLLPIVLKLNRLVDGVDETSREDTELHKAFETTNWSDRVRVTLEVMSKCENEEIEDRMAVLAIGCLMAHLRDKMVINAKGKLDNPIHVLVRESLKWRVRIGESASRIAEASGEILELARAIRGQQDVENNTGIQSQCGRTYFETPGTINVAKALVIAERPEMKDDVERLHETACTKWKFENVHLMKPLLNGKNLMKKLGIKQGGKYIGELMLEQRKWQLQNRNKPEIGNNLELLLEFLNTIKGPILSAHFEAAEKIKRDSEEKKRLKRERFELERRKAIERRAKKLFNARVMMMQHDKEPHQVRLSQEEAIRQALDKALPVAHSS